MSQELPRNRLPGIHLVVGVAALLLPLAARELVPASAAWSPAFLLPCLFVSSVCLPLGTWLALRSLLTESLGARQHLAQFFIGGKNCFLILLITFFACRFLDQLADTFQKDQGLAEVPRLVKLAQTSPDAAKRERTASYLFRSYGVIIAYPDADNQLAYFTPSQDDKFKRIQVEEVMDDAQRRGDFLRNLSMELAYVFYLYLGTYFTAFFLGGLILIFRGSEKQPRDSVLTTP